MKCLGYQSEVVKWKINKVLTSVESLYISTTVHDKILSVDWQMFSYQICLLLINSMVDSSIDSVIPVCVLRKKICFRIVPDNTLTINVRSKRS